VTEVASKHARSLLAHLIATEIEHVVRHDVTCPHPTATHERGDDVWTPDEQRAAVGLATKAHDPTRVVAADAASTYRILAMHESPRAMRLFLHPFLSTLEESKEMKSAFSYLQLHQASAVRAEVVDTAQQIVVVDSALKANPSPLKAPALKGKP
jgi:hypothetical protein